MRPHRVSWNPTDAHPSLLVDRDELRTELREDVLGFLERDDPGASSTWAVIGDKGIGKTILTRTVLDDVRAERSGSTVIAVVDCRKRRSWREALAQLCWALVVELRDLANNGSTAASEALLTEAQLLDELAKLDTAPLQTLHERVNQIPGDATPGVQYLLVKADELSVIAETLFDGSMSLGGPLLTSSGADEIGRPHRTPGHPLRRCPPHPSRSGSTAPPTRIHPANTKLHAKCPTTHATSTAHPRSPSSASTPALAIATSVSTTAITFTRTSLGVKRHRVTILSPGT